MTKIKPVRIQRKRTKDWKNTTNAIYVGRPTKWGNPYKVTKIISAKLAVLMYQDYLDRNPHLKEMAKKRLRGHDLCCWCPLGNPCHADVLLLICSGE